MLLNQLKKGEAVEFTRRAYNPDDASLSYEYATPETPDKVMTVTPGEGDMHQFKVDFVKDGVGGQEQMLKNVTVVGPFEVVVMPGELRVIQSIIETSLPQLVGWTMQMDVAVQRALLNSANDANRYGGGGGAGGGFYDDGY